MAKPSYANAKPETLAAAILSGTYDDGTTFTMPTSATITGGVSITNDGTFSKETGGHLASIDTEIGAHLGNIDTNTTGVATAANQTTGNTSIANVNTAIGAQADAVATTDTGTFSLLAFFKRLLQGITSLISNTGQGTTTTVGQTSVDTTPNGVVIGANPANRRQITMYSPISNTVAIYIRPTSVTTANGFILNPGMAFVDDTQAVWHAVVASVTSTMSWAEEV